MNLPFENTIDYAQSADLSDPLKGFRKDFFIPKNHDSSEQIYFCGNSLGLQPRKTQGFIDQELKDWRDMGVEGHFHAKNPWMPYHEIVTKSLARLTGSKECEVVAMNTLTVNLHLMMVSFYRPTKDRYKIVIESDAFPSDRYAVESQAAFHGYRPEDAIIRLSPREGESILHTEDIVETIRSHGSDIALILLGGVNYYTGQLFDLKKISKVGREVGARVGFDLAHAVGNVPLNLHNDGPDFAAWCSYKYLNGGPGCLGGCFIHERHAGDATLPRFAGWWGHDKETRFRMRDDFEPIIGVEGWQLSNPPIFSLASMRSALKYFDQAGMKSLREKSLQLTAYLEYLIRDMNDQSISILTPSDPDQRGCQLSIQVRDADKTLHNRLTKRGVISDWREPDVIRVAPVPLYNTFEEAFHFSKILQEELRME